MSIIVYTIGHSTRRIEEFVGILAAYKIEMVADVRTVPGSRHNPQYNGEELKKTLQQQNIKYLHLKRLGGLRHTTKASINTAWKNASFRGYADYMQTEEFEKGITELIEIARKMPTVIMCAEVVPWRCHRSLIGDALTIRNIRVEDIINGEASQAHKMTPFAQVEGKTITYPGKD